MAWSRLAIPCRKIYAAVLQSPSIRSCENPLRAFSCTKHLSSFSKTEDPILRTLVQGYVTRSSLQFKGLFRRFQHSRPTLLSQEVVLKNGPILILKKSFSTSSQHFAKSGGSNLDKSNTTGLIYIIAVFILMIGGSYAAVPLYKVFCQVSGLGGQAQRGHDTTKIEHMKKVDRQIKVRFNADVASSMRWNFRPQQTEVLVAPGETALAFYTAKNPTDKPIIGISTYNVLPYDAGQYFNKIQCFCFEEQRLNPNEQVDMPVFFFIDPEFAEDPKLEGVNTITLSYTFFEAKEGLNLPLPGYPQPHDPKVLAS